MIATISDAEYPYKFKVQLQGPNKKKTLYFGAAGYEDFTAHHDAERKDKYIARHGSREKWDDPYTKGFWSRWLLWEKKTLKAAAKFIEEKFGITIKWIKKK